MEDCKYRLPCGRCEKLGAPCDAPKECEHDWETVNFTMTNDDIVFHLKCRKCNITKDESMKRCFGAIKECDHDWHISGRLFGKEARYTMNTCSKCDKEETLKTFQDENGKWTTYVI